MLSETSCVRFPDADMAVRATRRRRYATVASRLSASRVLQSWHIETMSASRATWRQDAPGRYLLCLPPSKPHATKSFSLNATCFHRA
jgi:hypothetical protein